MRLSSVHTVPHTSAALLVLVLLSGCQTTTGSKTLDGAALGAAVGTAAAAVLDGNLLKGAVVGGVLGGVTASQ